MNIDWSKAPEDATHAGTTTRLQSPVFYKDIREDKYSYWYADGYGWREDAIGHPACTPLIELPKKQEAWDGEGLPPVGTVCEVLWNESRVEYLRTKVFGVNEHGQPIHRFDEGPKKYQYQADVLRTASGTQVFRTIRTAEQLAEEEREKEAIELYLTMQPASNSKAWDNIGDYARDRYRLAISSGYRKQ